jgi:hypothetical protein
MQKHVTPPPHLKGKALADWLMAEDAKASQVADTRLANISQESAKPVLKDFDAAEALWGYPPLEEKPQDCVLTAPVSGLRDKPDSGSQTTTSENKAECAAEAFASRVVTLPPDEDSTSVACIQENLRDSKRVFQRASNREYKDAYKSHTRAEAGLVSDQSINFRQKPSSEELERKHAEGVAWLLLDEQLRKISKKAKPFRNRFELARLAKFAASHGISDTKVRCMAEELMIPWFEVEELTAKVLRAPNENLFDLAIQQGKLNVTGLERLDPALHKVACLAFHLQVFAGDGTIYLVQNKIAEAFGTNQSTISRVIKHLKEAGWLVEVSREKKRHRDFVRYQCPPALKTSEEESE